MVRIERDTIAAPCAGSFSQYLYAAILNSGCIQNHWPSGIYRMSRQDWNCTRTDLQWTRDV